MTDPSDARGWSPRCTVAVIGNGSLPAGDPREALAEAIGAGIVEAGHVLVTGGLGGVMAAASRGARRSAGWQPGCIVGVLPGDDPGAANPWVDVPIATGQGHGRNRVVAHCDAVVAVGGGAGTLTELGFAWIHDRLVIALRCAGWSGRLADTRIDERVRRPGIDDDRVFGADDPAEALGLLRRWLPAYRGRPEETA